MRRRHRRPKVRTRVRRSQREFPLRPGPSRASRGRRRRSCGCRVTRTAGPRRRFLRSHEFRDDRDRGPELAARRDRQMTPVRRNRCRRDDARADLETHGPCRGPAGSQRETSGGRPGQRARDHRRDPGPHRAAHRSRRRVGCRTGGAAGRRDQVLERDPRIPDVTEPVLRVAVETAAQNSSDGRRRLRREARPVDVGAQHRSERVGHGLAFEGLAPGEHLVQDRAERPDVRPLVRRPCPAPAPATCTPPSRSPRRPGWPAAVRVGECETIR